MTSGEVQVTQSPQDLVTDKAGEVVDAFRSSSHWIQPPPGSSLRSKLDELVELIDEWRRSEDHR